MTEKADARLSMEDLDCHRQWDSDYFFPYWGRRMRAEYMQLMISRGLPFVRQIFESVGEKSKSLILSNRKDEETLFWDLWERYRPKTDSIFLTTVCTKKTAN